jgi:hypothetical protein
VPRRRKERAPRPPPSTVTVRLPEASPAAKAAFARRVAAWLVADAFRSHGAGDLTAGDNRGKVGHAATPPKVLASGEV